MKNTYSFLCWSALSFFAAALPCDPAVAQQGFSSSLTENPGTGQSACYIELWVTTQYGVAASSGIGGLAFGLLGGLVEAAANKESNVAKADELQQAIPAKEILRYFDTAAISRQLSVEKVFINLNTTYNFVDGLENIIQAQDRSTSNKSACYYEVVINSIEVMKNLGKRDLIVDFRVKYFSSQTVLGRKTEVRVVNLKLFPTSNPEKKQAAVEDVQKGFSKAVEKFVQKRMIKVT